MTELKMVAGYSGNNWFQNLFDRIGALFSRTEEIERQEEISLDDLADALGRANPRRPSIDSAALRGALETLQGKLQEAVTQWENTVAEAARLKRDIDNLTAGIAAITENFDQAYAQRTASAMGTKLAEATQEWDAVSAQAAELRAGVLDLQEQVRVIEAQVNAKSEELGMERKAFWDPQDDEDRARLTERIDDLATRVQRAVDRGDEDEIAELGAELRDLYDGLTDDTRYRISDLMDRLGIEGKAAPGAHTLYR